MASENLINTVPAVEAAADLSAKQFYVVKVTAAFRVNLTTVNGEKALGILQNKPSAAGQAATVAVGPSTSKAVASAAIAAGAFVAPTSAGKVRTAVTGDYPIGIALDTVTADLQLVTVQLGGNFGIIP